jgi:hypothetical protein
MRMLREFPDPKLWLRARSVVINANCFAGTPSNISAMPVYSQKATYRGRTRSGCQLGKEFLVLSLLQHLVGKLQVMTVGDSSG